jgi:hypothetical protein
MVAQLNDPIDGNVFLDGDAVRFRDFVETDPDFVRLIFEAESPEAVARTVLRVGAQAIKVAGASLDTDLVSRRFGVMSDTFEAKVDEAVSQITGVTAHLLDAETGALPKVLGDVAKEIESLLGATFDENSKSSAITKIEKLMSDAALTLDRSIRNAFDPSATDSPLARTKNEILTALKAETTDVRQKVQELTLMMVAKDAALAAGAKTAIKGFAYEELVEDGISRIATIYGDVVERVGTATGAVGTKNGDHKVTLNPEDTCGQPVSFVVESKDTKVSMTKILAELDMSLRNQGAVAAVAAFSSQDLAPTSVPLWWSGNRAIVVYDKDNPTPQALHLAYCWARWIARRILSPDGTAALDVARVEAALTRGRQALARHQTIKSCHSAAGNKITEAGAQVSALVDEINQVIRDVWDELSR